MVKPVELRQIRYFIEVALTQSFKGAAARLHVSQSSLSRRVADLERSLNAPLLVRHARGVSLTRHGQLFLDRASSVMREIELMQADAGGPISPPTGVVTVGSSGTLSRVLFAPLAAAFQIPPGAVHLRFFEGDQYALLEGLDTGRIDLAVITTPEPVANCRMEVLLEEQLFLISHKRDRPRKKSISVADLRGIPLVMFPRPSTNRDLIERKARESGISLDCKYESASAVVHTEFARLGLARNILPYFTVADQMRKSLFATPIRGLTVSQTLVWRNDRRQAAVVAEVAETIRKIMRRRLSAPGVKRLPRAG